MTARGQGYEVAQRRGATRQTSEIETIPFAAGCGDDDDDAGSQSLSCLMTEPSSRTCVRYENLTADQLTTVSGSCVSLTEEGTASKVDSCPTDDRVGACVREKGGLTFTLITYADGGATTETARTSCGGDTFTPSP